MKNENELFLEWLNNEGVSVFELYKQWGAIPFTVAILGWYRKWVSAGRPIRTTADTQN